ncbi:MAG: hypothetical protein E7293_03505 [Lachnospiraceae bacterium]|nr:hypothetical protein [Lachnospiraceae bacterium]
MTITIDGTKKMEVKKVEMGCCSCKRAPEGILVYLAVTDGKGDKTQRYLYDMEELFVMDAIQNAQMRIDIMAREGKVYVGDLWEE